jgi:rhamnose transport system permease protein
VTSDAATRTPGDQQYAGTDTSRQSLLRSAVRWEVGLVVVLVAVLIFGSSESSDFLNTTTFFYVGLNMGEIAIMALPLTLVIMTGEIDLSVASMLCPASLWVSCIPSAGRSASRSSPRWSSVLSAVR